MSEFSLRELECFLAVAGELSFTRAAQRLHLAQPPLSRTIKQLEEKLDVTLFERSKRKVELTQAGDAFLIESRDILNRVRRAGDAARRAAEGETDHLEIGFVSAVLSSGMVEAFSRFRKENPHIRINLHDRLPSEQLRALAEGEFDIGFIGIAPENHSSGIPLTPWGSEPLMAFLPPDHPLSDNKTVKLTALAEEGFVSIASEAAPAYAAHVRRICNEAGFRPRIVQEARRAQAVAAMTIAGSGVAILPASLHRLTGNGKPLRLSRNRIAKLSYVVASRENAAGAVPDFLALIQRISRK
ncbi:MAG: LysR substrate-binding domain-containing protein [Verrucomicrobiales bacterium]|nr:LysR substrate-binding domain-containing protein [Verrucomicrobiales bacterium]